MGGDADARGAIGAALERGGFSDVSARAEAPAPPTTPVSSATGACVETALHDGPDLVIAVDAIARARAAFPHAPLLAVPRVDAAPGELAGAMSAAAVAALQDGADDVVLGSLEIPVLASRARQLLAAAGNQRRMQCLARLQEAMLEILRLGETEGDSPETLREALRVASEAMEFDRASLIAHAVGSDLAYVIAATDEPELAHFAISVDKYPELRAVMETGRPVLLDDARTSPVTAAVADALSDKAVRGVAVFPVLWNREILGAVLFRRARPGVAHVDTHRQAFAVMVAAHMAARLQHGKVLESLREKTQRLSRARYEVERRLRTMDTLKQHFEAAADGVLVLDGEGRILFVNRAAEQITGFARDGLIDGDAGVLVRARERERVRRIVAQVLEGSNVDAFDLSLGTTSGETLCVSVTTSTVLSRSGAAVLSFRDVTGRRALEGELRKAKDFLERLIDSAVDAIVAADLRGNILIFNKGAERIFGYTAKEVIGRIPVWDLYAAGVPQQVMRMLRSTQYGGVGRIDQIRREIVNKRGERVPVNMTASVVYQDGAEVATVGIFSDLRDRIRIEQRLLQAQEKLSVTAEQQAMLAQLAGTAAHELNQPLTSIQACAEMLKRQTEPDTSAMRYVDSIVEQVERMATIVRRIGKITKYETKQYLPGTWIVDLDKSSPGEAEPGVELPARAPTYDGDVEGRLEFEEEHQITIARVELDDVLPEPEETTLVRQVPERPRAQSEGASADEPSTDEPRS